MTCGNNIRGVVSAIRDASNVSRYVIVFRKVLGKSIDNFI